MKRLLSAFLIAVLLFSGCAFPPATTPEEPETLTGKDALRGKKILFVGDSMVFWGQCVFNLGETGNNPGRYDDRGYFYRLCEANGVALTVTNWTFPGKGLEYIYKNYITNYKLPDNLQDFSYDYIIVSGGRSAMNTGEYMMGVLEKYVSLFREHNPDVKFVYLVSAAAHKVALNQSFPADLLNNLKNIEKMGFTVVDWGKVVSDIVEGTTPVPGATQPFTFNSFVVARTEEDGAHPNALAGYITALSVYCTLTGEKAEGQPYAFCDETLDARFRMDKYVEHNYKFGETNFYEIFRSPADMTGLQKLVDKCLTEKAYLSYQFPT